VGYEVYKKKIMPLCPVAVRQHQVEVHAPGHVHWGTVTCTGCGAKFDIGPNMIFGSRLTDVQAAKQFEATLAEDHKAGRPHQDSYEIRD
jgi:hypothetical protein